MVEMLCQHRYIVYRTMCSQNYPIDTSLLSAHFAKSLSINNFLFFYNELCQTALLFVGSLWMLDIVYIRVYSFSGAL